MTKYKFYSILGLASTCIIMFNYLIYAILTQYDLLTNGSLLLITLFSTISGLFIFLALRFIIVIISKLNNYKIVIPIIIISQILISALNLLIRYQVFSLLNIVIPYLIVGMVFMGSYLWFFILLSKTGKTEIQGLSFLQYFGIVLLILVVFKAIISVFPAGKIKSINSFIQIIEVIPYAFLLFFLFDILSNLSRDKEHPKLNTDNSMKSRALYCWIVSGHFQFRYQF